MPNIRTNIVFLELQEEHWNLGGVLPSTRTPGLHRSTVNPHLLHTGSLHNGFMKFSLFKVMTPGRPPKVARGTSGTSSCGASGIVAASWCDSGGCTGVRVGSQAAIASACVVPDDAAGVPGDASGGAGGPASGIEMTSGVVRRRFL
ncbi:MAG: hypothetical protein FJ211_11380 [Ignavibacteria bacterium]|nr:hypothetical protein [Ignavibacteria bacterium]